VQPASFELRWRRRRAWRCRGEIGENGFLDEGQGVIRVGLILDPHLEPVGVAPAEMDPGICTQLTAPSPDGTLGQPDVQGVLIVEVSDLASSDPESGA